MGETIKYTTDELLSPLNVTKRADEDKKLNAPDAVKYETLCDRLSAALMVNTSWPIVYATDRYKRRNDNWESEVTRLDRRRPDAPDAINDIPERARKRGFWLVDGDPILRRQKVSRITPILKGEVHFSEDVSAPCEYCLIDVKYLIPSHSNGHRNWRHFIPEAQPKNRTDDVSVATADAHAKNIVPDLLFDNYYAYSGAPVVNTRGEVIQGNGRAEVLRIMFERYPDSIYKYLKALNVWIKKNTNKWLEWCISDPKNGKKATWPVLVRMIDCTDEEAIKLGRYTDTQITTGGSTLFDPENVSQQLLCDKKLVTFSRIVFDTGDDDDDTDNSLREFIRKNGVDALKWLCGNGYITSAEVNACLKASDDGVKQITPKAIDALHQIFTSTLFRNTSNGFDLMFDALPVKAQAAIFETITRDFTMPDDKKLIPLIREAVEVCYTLLRKSPGFKKARNMQQVKQELWMWENQGTMFSSDKFPADKYSTHSKLLAALFKVSTQSQIRNTITDIYDKMEGKGTPDMFSPDPFGVPLSKEDALNRVLGTSLGKVDAPTEAFNSLLNYEGWPKNHQASGNLSDEQLTDVFLRLVVPLCKMYDTQTITRQGARGDEPIDLGLREIADFYRHTNYDPKQYDAKAAEVEKMRMRAKALRLRLKLKMTMLNWNNN